MCVFAAGGRDERGEDAADGPDGLRVTWGPVFALVDFKPPRFSMDTTQHAVEQRVHSWLMLMLYNRTTILA